MGRFPRTREVSGMRLWESPFREMACKTGLADGDDAGEALIGDKSVSGGTGTRFLA